MRLSTKNDFFKESYIEEDDLDLEFISVYMSHTFFLLEMK
jgi:hypothetical protein